MRCDFCGASSRLTDLFLRRPSGLGTFGEMCPRCRARSQAGGSWSWMAPWLLVALVTTGFFVGGLPTALAWAFGGIVLPILLIVVHECVHGVAGALVGARIFEVGIGWRRPRWRWKFRHTWFSIA